jgi:hypothetical protein
LAAADTTDRFIGERDEKDIADTVVPERIAIDKGDDVA